MDLTKGSIPKLIRQIAIPASVGFFFHTLYNIVDTFYAGLISTEAIAALSLSFPIFFIVIALGSGIGAGANVLMSNYIGEKKRDVAAHVGVQGITFSVLISLLLTVLGLAFAPFLFNVLGATGEYLAISLSYMNIISYGAGAFMLFHGCNAILNAQGNTKPMRNSLIFGFFLNLILDPIFALGWLGFPKMGVAGVALATVLIELGAALYLFYEVTKTPLWKKVTSRFWKPVLSIYRDIMVQGLPASLNMVTVAIGIFIITYFVSPFGAAAVAAYGIATRIEQIFLMPTIGLNIAVLTLVGQNNGAKKFDRVKEIYQSSLKYGLWVSAIGLVVVLVIPKLLMKIFTQDAQVIAIGVPYLYIAAFLFYGYVILFMTVALYQGLKKPSFGLYVGILRQVILPILMFPFLIYGLNMGIFGVWWGVATILTLSAVPVWLLGQRKIKKLTEKKS